MSKQRDLGTSWETAVVNYLRENGFKQAERRALAGALDKGDILATSGVIISCKNYAAYSDGDVVKWQGELRKQMGHANASVGLLVIKRRGLTGQPGNAWTWWQGEFGFWHAQRLTEAVERLRVLGWGDPFNANS